MIESSTSLMHTTRKTQILHQSVLPRLLVFSDMMKSGLKLRRGNTFLASPDRIPESWTNPQDGAAMTCTSPPPCAFERYIDRSGGDLAARVAASEDLLGRSLADPDAASTLCLSPASVSAELDTQRAAQTPQTLAVPPRSVGARHYRGEFGIEEDEDDSEDEEEEEEDREELDPYSQATFVEPPQAGQNAEEDDDIQGYAENGLGRSAGSAAATETE